MPLNAYRFNRTRPVVTNHRLPKPIHKMWFNATKREIRLVRFGSVNLRGKKDPGSVALRKRLDELELSNELVWDRESKREQVQVPIPLKVIYVTLCTFIDIVFKDRPLQRFWFLETVARMPYFSYISILHLYETLGWWQISSDLKMKHTEQELNEGEHLHIMELLGGDTKWSDRFLARHSAILYFITLLVLYAFAPDIAYKSSELLERHAVDTYGQFLDQNRVSLKELPGIMGHDTLYSVFENIMEDEHNHAEHITV